MTEVRARQASAEGGALILTLAHLLDGNPVLPLGRNIKSPGRYLYGFLGIGGLDGPKVFRTLADNIDTPARYSNPGRRLARPA